MHGITPPAMAAAALGGTSVEMASMLMRPSYPTAQGWLVGAIAGVLLISCLAGSAYFARRSPAGGLALLGAAAGGVLGYIVNAGPSLRDVPYGVALWASGGLVVGGVIGLLFRGRGPAESLRSAASWILLLGLVAAGMIAWLLLEACPLYITRGAGVCYYKNDVLGGWVSAVVFLFVLDVIAVAALLALSSLRVAGTDGSRGT
jgi:hypothetical protein